MKNKITITLLLATLAFCSCKKNDVSPNTLLQDGKSTVITDLAGDTEASLGEDIPGKEQRPFYIFLFRFKDQKQIWIKTKADSAKYLKTNDWDIAFTGLYNSEVYANNGSVAVNPGYEGPATNAVVKVDNTYDKVTEAPGDDAFTQSRVSVIGRAEAEGSAGWYTYTLSTHIMQPLKNRTYIIKLTSGKFAKLELINVYKGNPPAVTDLYWPAPYLTFRYFVQEDGSRNLKTK
ncbi:hypothetical protein GCM10023149_23430 [Mucilaginibacter gynuensis]|uniref:Heme-binding HmuY-like protein n=1 Tax=Mucilaginibacter gynuensis TaxID=1302236 RepID=A0ABP8GF68_9SPHI